MEQPIDVLYLVNDVEPSSIADEIAEHIDEPDVRVTLGTFYASSRRADLELFDDVLRLEARHAGDLRAARTLWRFLRENRPDVIHLHHTASSIWGAAIGRLSGIPKIVKTEHNNHRFFTTAQDAANFFTLGNADFVITNSDHTQQSFYPWEDLVAPAARQTVYNGVDFELLDDCSVSRQSVRTQFGVGDDELLVGTVGRLVEQKNFARLIEAVGTLDPCLHLVIVGGGPRAEMLRRCARRHRVRERVHFVGNVERRRVYEILHGLDAYVMPSLWEGFCVAVVEAMAAGNPVLCSDIPTLREVVGEVADYFDPKSVRQIAESIARLEDCEARRLAEWGERCAERARRRYAIARTAAHYADVYRDAVGVVRTRRN